MSEFAAPSVHNPAGFIRERIRTVPDWPQPGVQFRDITPVLQDRRALRTLIDLLVQRYIDARIDTIAGLDARGHLGQHQAGGRVRARAERPARIDAEHREIA